MGAYGIATGGKPTLSWTDSRDPIDAVTPFISYVRETSRPTIKGLVNVLAGELQSHRADGQDFLGGSSSDLADCTADSEVLLARGLLDRSSHGLPEGYVVRQLENIAWYIATREGGKDSFHNWLEAERRYIKGTIADLSLIRDCGRTEPTD